MTIPIKGSPKYLQFMEKYEKAKALEEKVKTFSYLDYLKSRTEEFYNKNHDAAGRFTSGTGGAKVPKEELGVIDKANPDIKDELSTMLSDRRRIEPAYTKLLNDVAQQSGGEMLGLDFKFKGAEGIVGKVDRKVKEKGLSPEDAIDTIGDSLRYTMALPPTQYMQGLNSAVKALTAQGAKFESLENNWQPGDAYNGVNAVFQDPKTGLKIELQFHTPESFHIKDKVIHKDYEFVRELKGSSAQRLLALERMRSHSDSVEFPHEIEKLTGHVHSVPVKHVFRPFREHLFASASPDPTPDADSWMEAENNIEDGTWTKGDWEEWVDKALGQWNDKTAPPETITASALVNIFCDTETLEKIREKRYLELLKKKAQEGRVKDGS